MVDVNIAAREKVSCMEKDKGKEGEKLVDCKVVKSYLVHISREKNIRSRYEGGGGDQVDREYGG
jgi:hypothetical protein